MGASRGFLFAVSLVLGLAGSGLAIGAAKAQTLGRVVSPILTVDRERLFAGSLYGQRINRELEGASAAMAAETRKIETALEAEELELTDQRATLAPEAFRALANAFDEKVQALRKQRETAETNLRQRIEDAQLNYFDQIGPLLGELVRERGAVMILDRRAILLTAADVDITDAAIARIDAVLGDGTSAEERESTPSPEPAPIDTIPAPEPAPESSATE